MGPAIYAQTGERIFTYDAAGNVAPNTKFIDKQELWNDGTVMTHEADVTVQSSDKAYTYTLNLLQMETADEMKVFDVIDIKCAGKSIFKMKFREAWDGDIGWMIIPNWVTSPSGTWMCTSPPWCLWAGVTTPRRLGS